jgi:hypothetical protein
MNVKFPNLTEQLKMHLIGELLPFNYNSSNVLLRPQNFAHESLLLKLFYTIHLNNT